MYNLCRATYRGYPFDGYALPKLLFSFSTTVYFAWENAEVHQKFSLGLSVPDRSPEVVRWIPVVTVIIFPYQIFEELGCLQCEKT